MQVSLDGRSGEGGGQILRSALALAAATGTPFRMEHIRGNRRRPGLAPQHLTAVRAAARLCRAHLEGAALRSESLVFRPTRASAAVVVTEDVARQSKTGSAGSISLVLQSLIPAARVGLTFALSGGTHVPWSPPYHYLAWVHMPLLRRMGWDVAVNLRRWGFYPTGAGYVEGEVRRVGTCPVDLRHRGPLREIVGISAAANLPETIARRQARAALATLEDRGFGGRIEAVPVTASCPGTAVVLAARFENGVGGASALGRKGLPAEEVGRRAARSLLAYVSSDAALDQHQADQLVIPAALAKGQSLFTVARVTTHLLTVAEVASAFLGHVVTIRGAPGEEGTVCVKGIAS